MLALFSLAVAAWTVAAAPLESHSFQPPFTKVDYQGQRIINETWAQGGTVEILKNFVRLTPDRQNRNGYVWSREALRRDTFSAVMQFRISGQGQKWFGDGIGLWVTPTPHSKGPNHGIDPAYYGVGIIIDTFVNSEHKGGHKDVTLQINDGTKNLDTLNDETKIGCDGAFRYHENSDGFDPVYSASRLRVVIERNNIKIEIDPKSQAEWSSCYEGQLPFPADWLENARIGITGSTGGLADNHDVISFLAFTDVNDMDLQLTDSEVYWNNYSKEHRDILKSEHCDQSCKLIILEKAVSNVKIENEHTIVSLTEKTQNSIAKVKAREALNQGKIQELTDRIEQYMNTKLDSTTRDVAGQMENELSAKVNEKVESASGWKFPFFLLAAGLIGSGAFIYKKYNDLRKSHLL
ncbi:lectin [Thraustotheca clavata]|uniref:Lectin n=1 Tax=Thraustotheca clavata TaxID=74557 RepID=A0A1W0A9K6_9STRA|nr:lectin [Thraustotheca clavata]